MRVYLAGPMSNIPHFNVPAFLRAGEKLEAEGHTVFNPAVVDIERVGWEFYHQCPKGSHDELDALGITKLNYRDCLRLDLNWIIDHAEAIALLPGWERSKGVAAEIALARALGIQEIVL